jgi:phage recombination protein Bet
MNAPVTAQQTPIAAMASRLSLDEKEMQGIVLNTLMKAKSNGQQVSNEEFVTFLVIANEYQLNPLSKEIYAFANRGAIQPIVSIDGWLKIINQHPAFDGMEFIDIQEGGELSAITCRIYRKDRQRYTEVTEYLNECAGTSEPWKKWPARMLRHKATIQAARYAFGLSGIVDPDEAERIKQSVAAEKNITPQEESRPALEYYPVDSFDQNFPKWKDAIEAGKKTPDQIIQMVSSKALLTDEQKQQIMGIK